MPDRPSRKLKVFLCHASEDKPKVRELYKNLSEDGYEVWFDEKSILPGQDWKIEIHKALRNSDIILFCLSKTSTNKEGFVQAEFKEALEIAKEKPEETIFIIPLRLEECPTPSSIEQWQWVNLFNKDGYVELKKSLNARASKIETLSNIEIEIGKIKKDNSSSVIIGVAVSILLIILATRGWMLSSLNTPQPTSNNPLPSLTPISMDSANEVKETATSTQESTPKLSAASINLIPTDLGSDYYLTEETGQWNVSTTAKDANIRYFSRLNNKETLSSAIYIFDIIILNTTDDVLNGLETELRNSLPESQIEFQEKQDINIGDRGGYRAFSITKANFLGCHLAFVKDSIVVVIVESGSSHPCDNAIKSAKIIENFIVSPRDNYIIPTATSVNFEPYTNLESVKFRKYQNDLLNVSLQLPDKGCLDVSQESTLTVVFSCSIDTKEFVSLQVVFKVIEVQISKTEGEGLVNSYLESMKPIGLIINHKNLINTGTDGNKYFYSFDFSRPEDNNGKGFAVIIQQNQKFGMVVLLTFKPEATKFVFDKAFQSIEISE